MFCEFADNSDILLLVYFSILNWMTKLSTYPRQWEAGRLGEILPIHIIKRLHCHMQRNLLFLFQCPSLSWDWAVSAAYIKELENNYASMVASYTTRYLQLFLIWWSNEHLVVHTMISNFVPSDSIRVPVPPEYRSGRLRQQWLQSLELP